VTPTVGSLKSRCAGRLAYLVRWPIARALLAMSWKKVSHGIIIADFTIDGTDSPLGARVEEALDMLERVDPRRARIVSRELSVIAVSVAEGPAFWPHAIACVMPSHYVQAEGVDGLAIAIVHEATHARLWRRGFRYEPEIRGRIERACVREEIRFARRLPDPAEILARLEGSLQKRWWTSEALQARRRRELDRHAELNRDGS